MQALELVKDETANDRTPDAASTSRLFEETKKRGLLIGRGGLYGNVIRIAPPLNVTRAEIDEGLKVLDASLRRLRRDHAMSSATASRPPPTDRLESELADKKPLYSEAEARAEAERCLYCVDAPCIKACPTEIDIPTFIKKIATRQRPRQRHARSSSRTSSATRARASARSRCSASATASTTAGGASRSQIGRLQRFATETATLEGRPRAPDARTSRPTGEEGRAHRRGPGVARLRGLPRARGARGGHLREEGRRRRPQHDRHRAVQAARRRRARTRSSWVLRARRRGAHRRRGRSRRDGAGHISARSCSRPTTPSSSASASAPTPRWASPARTARASSARRPGSSA